MFCDKCGNEVDNEAKFCKNCGNKLTQENSNDAIEIDNNMGVQNIKKNKSKNKPALRNNLLKVVILSILLIVVLVSSFFGVPTGQECIKIVNVDGVEITYRYDYSVVDGETLVQKRYKGIDSAGNEVDTRVTIWYNGGFEGKIIEDYTPTEADKMYGNKYYKQLELNGTINGYNVDYENEKLLIDSAVYEKYTDMIDAVEGCGMYVKFTEGSNTYTKIVASRLGLIIVIMLFDLIAIEFYVFDFIKFKKHKDDKLDDRNVEIQHKIGMGVLLGALLPLIVSIRMLIMGKVFISVLIFAIAGMIATIGNRLIKDGKLKKIVKISLILSLIVICPILFIFFMLGMI